MAILLVLAGHVVMAPLGGNSGALAPAGVEVFFALSGFLITALLLDEMGAAGRVSLPAFYARRARRLFPALAAVLIFLAALAPLMAARIVPAFWPTIFYVANWQYVAGHDLGVLNPTWSLSVEEQFYLVWPVLLVLVARWRRGPAVAAVALILGSLAERFVVSPTHAYYGTDTQTVALMLGALLAIGARGGLAEIRLPAWVPAVALLPLFGFGWLTSGGWQYWLPVLVPAVTGVVIWGACCNPGGPLTWSWLGYVGRRSYAMYLWHYPILWLSWMAAPGSAGAVVVGIGLTIGIAELSWRLVEAPILARVSSPQRGVRREPRGRQHRVDGHLVDAPVGES